MNSKWIYLLPPLTLYAPYELTRIIIDWEFVNHMHTATRPLWQYACEIIFIWLCYILAMFITFKLVGKLRNEREQRKE